METGNYHGDNNLAMEIHEQIKAERERRGWSQDELAQRVGISQPAIRKIEGGLTKKSRFLQDVLRVLGIDDRKQQADGEYKPPPDFLGPRDLKVFSAVEGGAGEMVVDNTPIETVPRPWYVANSPDAYAVLVVGDSMFPVIRPGQMVVVNPRLPPIPGEPAIFLSEMHGEFRATVKELRKSTARAWHVHQWNPPEGQEHDFTLSRDEWTKAYRVVGWFAGR